MMWSGEQVRAMRDGMKLSRRKFAELSGLTETKIHNIEKGRELKTEEIELLRPFMDGVEGTPAEQPELPTEDEKPAEAPAPEPEPEPEPEPSPKNRSSRRTMECPADDCRAQLLVDTESDSSTNCWACKSEVSSDGTLVVKGTPLEGNPITTPLPSSAPGGGEGAPPENAAPSSATSPEEQPVYLESPDEDDEDADAEVIPGSGLPTRYGFQLPGYPVSNSELQTFKRCRRKWYLAYYRQFKLQEPDLVGARALGTRVHLALAAYYSSREEDPFEVLEKSIEDDRDLLIDRGDIEAQEVLEKEAELATIMMQGYMEWVQDTGSDEGIEVIGDEVIVEAPFPAYPGVNLVGKMDLRVRREADGARMFMDHKTVGSLTEPLKTLHLDEQMLHYHMLEFLDFINAGLDPAEQEHAQGGLYNMIRKVKRTATAKPPFFDRAEVRHNAHELRSHYNSVFGAVNDIMTLKSHLDQGADHKVVAYPSKNGNCSWDCDFLPVCPLFDDGSAAEELLAEHYVSGNPHEYYFPYGEKEHTRATLIEKKEA